jgi:hypothetical protein
VKAGAVKEIVGGVKEREATDQRAGEAFAFEARPGPGGVDLLEMIAAVELVREFEVVEDSKDGLGDFHEGWLLSLVMLADERVRGCWLQSRCYEEDERLEGCWLVPCLLSRRCFEKTSGRLSLRR